MTETSPRRRARINRRKAPSATLDESQLEGLRDQLIGKRRELVESLEALNRQIAMKQDCSVSDAAEAAALRESALRASGIAEQHNRTLIAIDQALERLENGTYGICDETGEPIAYERLLAVPWARTA